MDGLTVGWSVDTKIALCKISNEFISMIETKLSLNCCHWVRTDDDRGDGGGVNGGGNCTKLTD